MIELALFNPVIPPNTGNLIRLTANMGTHLHLIHPLGFALDEKKLKRAGLDYHEWASVQEHEDFTHFKQNLKPRRIIACETSGTICYADFKFKSDDIILLGSETIGLPPTVLEQSDAVVVLPMQAQQRSLNLSNAASIIMYEAWRQIGFINKNS